MQNTITRWLAVSAVALSVAALTSCRTAVAPALWDEPVRLTGASHATPGVNLMLTVAPGSRHVQVLPAAWAQARLSLHSNTVNTAYNMASHTRTVAFQAPDINTAFGAPVALVSQNNTFEQVAIGTTGLLYVSGSPTCSVQVFTASGTPNPLTVPIVGFQARGVAVDPAGLIYVADETNKQVLRFEADGTPGLAVTTVNPPYGVAVDAAGNIYVSEPTSGTVKKFTAKAMVSQR